MDGVGGSVNMPAFPNILSHFTIKLQVLVMSQLTVENFRLKGIPSFSVMNAIIEINTEEFNGRNTACICICQVRRLRS